MIIENDMEEIVIDYNKFMRAIRNVELFWYTIF